MLWPSVQAKPKFNANEVLSRGHELMICDLDGDNLKDFVLLDDLNLSIFYQDRRDFARQPQQTYRLEHRPSLVWSSKLGREAESFLVMTSDGVSELNFANRTGSPGLRQIIRQPTIVPEVAEGTNTMCFSLSVKTARDWPLLLLPAADGLHVWEYRDGWRQAQVIGHAMDASVRPALANPGYATWLGLDLSVGDINGDGRDDLIVQRSQAGRTKTYRLYLQQTNGLFTSEPALTFTDKVTPFSWLCWTDLNRDGQADLIKSVCLKEPSFVPGIPSAKVMVSTYVADEQGRIPAEPQQVFRKNDSNPSLPVVDVDGDGFLDLVLVYRHMESKENLAKLITAKLLDYSLRFFFYRPGIGFPKEADCQRDVAFRLDRAELSRWIGTEDHEHYANLAGDFSGDGKTDLLVREHDDEISIYFFVSREKGFSPKPDLRFGFPEQIDAWEARDLNNDGVSDLIVKLRKHNGFRVFISQK